MMDFFNYGQLKIEEIFFKMFRQTHPVYGLLTIDE